MATPFKTPGVFIEEKNAFPNSIVAVATAVPVFIGYTEKADRNGQSLMGIPTAIDSMKEYTDLFGKEYHHQFGLADATHKILNFTPALLLPPATIFYLYNCLRLS